MNKKGFTLIELLVVIVIIGLLGVIVVPYVLNILDQSEESSYHILLNNIVTASQTYYEECEYGDLSNRDKYGGFACQINNNTITTTVGTLADVGLLDATDENGTKKVINPQDNVDISNCSIIITKIRDVVTDENDVQNVKISYQIQSNSADGNCPETYQTEGE